METLFLLLLFVFSCVALTYTCSPLSETALLISFGHEISLPLHEQVMEAKRLIEKNLFKGLTEIVPAYNSLAVYFDPLQIEKKNRSITEIVEIFIQSILDQDWESQPEQATGTITIPVCYDEIFGIDLRELSQTLQLSFEEIIQLHCSRTYKVFMTGFTPGFPYMGVIDDRLVTKRKASPRVKVEAGSVAIAGTQTGIYPLSTPGGWNIIGKTPLELVDPFKENPFLLKAGDEVRFESITRKEMKNWHGN